VSAKGVAQVPVQMGSEVHLASEAGCFRFTWARFPAGAVLEPHTHDRVTFAVILQGGFDLRFTSPAIRRRELACGPATIFSEPPGEMHSNHLYSAGATVVVVQPDPKKDDVFGFCDDVLDRVNHFRHGAIERLARKLAREIETPDELSHLAAEALALEMLVEATRLGQRARTRLTAERWLQWAEQIVHERFRERLTITGIAREVGVHPAHLAARFRESYHEPLGTYVRRLRIQWAADEIARGDEPLASIAVRAGFSDQAHLTRALKREIGWTPARYRQSRR
jgi:AraC family transcriptional regulator